MIIEKRIRLALAAIITSLVFLVSTFFFFDRAFFFLPVLCIVMYVSAYFALLEDIEKIELITLFIVPILFVISSYFFYFLFPVRWLTRLPFIILIGISVYALLLSSNIFNVGVEKNLQLYRAGFSVNYLFQTVIYFLFSIVVASFHWGFLANAFVLGILGFILSFQLYWSIKLDLIIKKEIIQYAAMTAFILGEGSILLSFLPIQSSIFGLVIAVGYYSVTGLTYLFIDERLFKHSLREYIFILFFIGIILVLSMAW